MCPDGSIYFYMCILCRIVTGIGSSMGLSYAIVGYYFPTKISSIVVSIEIEIYLLKHQKLIPDDAYFEAMLEVFNGLGLMVSLLELRIGSY